MQAKKLPHYENAAAPGVVFCKASGSDLAMPPDPDCPAFALSDGQILITDSNDPQSPVLSFDRRKIALMFKAVRDGEFDHLLAD